MIALKVKISSERASFYIDRFFHSMHTARKYVNALRKTTPIDFVKYYKRVYP